MRFLKMNKAEARDGDSPEMIAAIEALHARGYEPRRPANNNYQIKVNPNLSYYPGTGTTLTDGASSPLSERGLDALLKLLERQNTELSFD